MNKTKPKIIFLLGPTGVGKSEFAVKLARKINGEIISCDSMQVYKGMAILSQYPSYELRRTISHYLIGILKPSQEWSAADFIEKAKKITDEIIRRGKVPIIAGGTGLYARAFIEGLFPSPAKDEKLRRKIYKEARQAGNAKIYDRLAGIDPVYAAKVHPNDTRRIVRALEVYKLTGRPISEQHKETIGLKNEYDISVFILNRNRDELYGRINRRVDDMFRRGAAKEVEKLKRLRLSRTAKAVLGYKEIDDYINGKTGRDEAKDLIKINTRRYAKRQLTWFRREKGATWLKLGGNDKVLINKIWKKLY
ncbi:MAG: tRNA (adenosine(37)-N6)-dimethylallyltransferase MiaA [Candidatus Omnitrophica bacterium]|nr:tRNA (adenosine(37)-N6)-dimethylallyltransferase MiaA [Candidatus Omnitrophota bacterium]